MNDARYIAHFNWATLRAPVGDPLVAPFVDAVPKVNALAERSAGFVWRHGDEAAAGAGIGWPLFTGNDRMIASFSVWETAEALRAYVYKTVHGGFFRRGEAWFLPDAPRGNVLWPVPQGHIPDIAEARAMVERLEREGPSEAVFPLSHGAPA